MQRGVLRLLRSWICIVCLSLIKVTLSILSTFSVSSCLMSGTRRVFRVLGSVASRRLSWTSPMATLSPSVLSEVTASPLHRLRAPAVSVPFSSLTRSGRFPSLLPRPSRASQTITMNKNQCTWRPVSSRPGPGDAELQMADSKLHALQMRPSPRKLRKLALPPHLLSPASPGRR